jgi:hypothetical protein
MADLHVQSADPNLVDSLAKQLAHVGEVRQGQAWRVRRQNRAWLTSVNAATSSSSLRVLRTLRVVEQADILSGQRPSSAELIVSLNVLALLRFCHFSPT